MMRCAGILVGFVAVLAACGERLDSDTYAAAIQQVEAAMGGRSGPVDPYQLRVLPNPKGDGLFVYCPEVRDNCRDANRRYIWLVLDSDVIPLNAPSHGLLRAPRWPREIDPSRWARTGLDPFSAAEAIGVVFGTQ